MTTLKPCPCGKTPTSLSISDNGSKWAYVSGNCCGEWSIEFRTQYNLIETDECMSLAIAAWNEADRSNPLDSSKDFENIFWGYWRKRWPNASSDHDKIKNSANYQETRAAFEAGYKACRKSGNGRDNENTG
jgi:hypothetical protein